MQTMAHQFADLVASVVKWIYGIVGDSANGLNGCANEVIDLAHTNLWS
jgi:hypothetical protein